MMRAVLAALTVAAMACGGSGSGSAAAAQADHATGVAETTSQVATGTVHEVQMLLTSDRDYVFQPAELAVKVGDRVRWVNVSGGPHNVAFYAEGVPEGAREFLNAAMANRMGDLTGQLLIQPDATYEISFDGAPAGTYEYVCTPHEMLGMKARLTLTE